MIHLADAAIVAWLSTLDPPIEVSLGPPRSSEGSSRRSSRPALGLELVSVGEQVDRRDNEIRDIRAADGRVVERRRATRWFELDYRCTVSGDDIESHRVLGAILQLLVDHEVVPAAHVPAELASPDVPITVQIAPDGRSSISTGILIRVVVPVRPTAEREIAPPAVVLHLDVAQEPGREAETGPVKIATAPTPPLERAWTTVRRREFIAGPHPDATVTGGH